MVKAIPDLRKMVNIIQNRLFLRLPGADSILNIGAADGNFIVKYPWREYKLINLDNNSEENEFENCIKKYNEKDYPNIRNIKANCWDMLMLNKDSFDMVIFTHVIEHLTEDEIEMTLIEIKRVLKPGGIMITSTPNKRLRQYFGVYKLNTYHIEEYTLEEFKNYMTPHFTIMKEYGAFWFDIETKKSLPEKIDDPDNSYAMMLICKNDKK